MGTRKFRPDKDVSNAAQLFVWRGVNTYFDYQPSADAFEVPDVYAHYNRLQCPFCNHHYDLVKSGVRRRCRIAVKQEDSPAFMHGESGQATACSGCLRRV